MSDIEKKKSELIKRIAQDGYYSDNNTSQDWFYERMINLGELIESEVRKARIDELENFPFEKLEHFEGNIMLCISDRINQLTEASKKETK